MSGVSSVLQIMLPGPDVGAVKHLTALLEVRTGAVGITAGTTNLSVSYPDDASAREAMGRVLSERPDVRCSVEASRPPAEMGDG